MSDFTDLFLPASNPKALSLTQFIQKEEANLAAAVQKLPAEVQPFVDTTITTAEDLASVLATVGGTALGAFLSTELPAVESVIVSLLTRAGIGAGTAAASAGAATIEKALLALVQELVNSVVAGLGGSPAVATPASPTLPPAN